LDELFVSAYGRREYESKKSNFLHKLKSTWHLSFVLTYAFKFYRSSLHLVYPKDKAVHGEAQCILLPSYLLFLQVAYGTFCF